MAENTQPQKLKEIYQQSQEDRNKEDLDFLLREKEADLKSSILATEKALSQKRRERKNYLFQESLDFKKLMSLDDEIESLESGVAQLKKYQEDLF